jgi:hypothetical protein
MPYQHKTNKGLRNRHRELIKEIIQTLDKGIDWQIESDNNSGSINYLRWETFCNLFSNEIFADRNFDSHNNITIIKASKYNRNNLFKMNIDLYLKENKNFDIRFKIDEVQAAISEILSQNDEDVCSSCELERYYSINRNFIFDRRDVLMLNQFIRTELIAKKIIEAISLTDDPAKDDINEYERIKLFIPQKNWMSDFSTEFKNPNSWASSVKEIIKDIIILVAGVLIGKIGCS